MSVDDERRGVPADAADGRVNPRRPGVTVLIAAVGMQLSRDRDFTVEVLRRVEGDEPSQCPASADEVDSRLT